MNKRRLLKLADFLGVLPRQKFDFASIAVENGKPMREALKAGKTRCGTVGCAMGWSPAVFPRLLAWVRVRKRQWTEDGKPMYAVCLRAKSPGSVDPWRVWDVTVETAKQFFDLEYDDVQRLFNSESGLGDAATPKQVARHIRRFVARGGAA